VRGERSRNVASGASAPVLEGYLSSGFLLACHGMAFACSLFCLFIYLSIYLFIYFYFWEMPFACSAADE